MINIIYNMETADPDDALTLCMLSSHPKVNLVAVTITPGSSEQVTLVKSFLHALDKYDTPVGVRNGGHPKSCVSEFHYKWFGERILRSFYVDVPKGEDVIAEAVKQYGDIKIVSGAALSCVANYLNNGGQLGEVIIQGGFAGDNVVPEEYRLEKFKGRTTCPTFNLNADVKAALCVAETQQIKLKRFVSKNVCHGVIYDNEMHERIKPYRHNNIGLDLMVDGMDFYLRNKKHGKAFHDPLAACVAIDPFICQYAEVAVYREKGEWGSRKIERNGPGSDTFISISVDREAFENILVGKER